MRILCALSAVAFLAFAADGGVATADLTPQPVETDVEIHAFYYPGTEQRSEWELMERTMPWTKPLLGWYDEGDPRVVEWQIKWAAEHGIHAFCVDWYWHRGVQRLDHWVKAFYRAKNRRFLKWYMMYANHNDPGSHTEADTRRLVAFWCENYFNTPEYYRIDGKPVVVLWDYRTLGNDFAAEAKGKGEEIPMEEGLRRALGLIRECARQHGVSELYLMDVRHGWEASIPASSLKAAGYDAQTLYGWDKQAFEEGAAYLKKGDSEKRFDYELCRPTINDWWRKTSIGAPIPFWPFVPTGWDCRPRNFQTPRRVIYGRTPEKFRAILSDCREFCRTNGLKRLMIGPVNEWQEGSYIEPNSEWGFGYYDAIREVFVRRPALGWPANVTPAQLGEKLIEYPELEPLDVTKWDFANGGTQGWFRNPYGTPTVRNVAGCLSLHRVSSPYGAIRTRIRPIDASRYRAIALRMKIDQSGLPSWVHEGGPEIGCVRWGTVEKPLIVSSRREDRVTFDTSRKASFGPNPDGAMHDYLIPLRKEDGWEGTVDEIWLDPDNVFFSRIAISSIELIPAK